ncbi:MAG TPA: hypothetical protein DCL44_12335 [Elusimicrobia bacterium]|nr:hypothetical protein [Elusimicrobiota bacterium]
MAKTKKHQKHTPLVAGGNDVIKSNLKSYTNYLILSAILLLTIIVFSDSLKNSILTCWDDNQYITDNIAIRGLAFENIRTFFSKAYVGCYLPLTMLTYAFDYRLFGLNPASFHFTNLFIHLLNVILVFIFIQKLAGEKKISTIAALIFAIHPMHVESVAWLSERKDVLYSFFFLSSLICYLNYLKDSFRLKHLFYCLILFICSLLSKPAAIPLPLVLILLDYYYSRDALNKKAIIEKIPFFILAIIFGVILLFTQNKFEAITQTFYFYERFFLTSYAIVFYVIKMIAPLNLCAMYYYPAKSNGFLPIEYYLAPLLIVAVIYGIYKSGVHKKHLISGFLFYLITIILIIQIKPVGSSIVSDRYSYIPYIGLSFIAGYFYVFFVSKNAKLKLPLNLLILCSVLTFSVLTWKRNRVWADSLTLWTDVANKHPNVYHAWSSLGFEKIAHKDYKGAVEAYNVALALKDTVITRNDRGIAQCYLNNFSEAIADFSECIKKDPAFADPYYNRGLALEKLNRNYPEILKDYSKAVQLNPKYLAAYGRRGFIKYVTHDLKGALEDCDKVIELNPNLADSYFYRGMVLFAMERFNDAIKDYDNAININPAMATVFTNRGIAKLKLNDKKSACLDWRAAAEKGDRNAEKYLKSDCN